MICALHEGTKIQKMNQKVNAAVSPPFLPPGHRNEHFAVCLSRHFSACRNMLLQFIEIFGSYSIPFVIIDGVPLKAQ